MRPGAILHLATDWEPYAEFMLKVMQSADGFVNLSPAGNFSDKPEWRPETKYERRGERLGHRVALQLEGQRRAVELAVRIECLDERGNLAVDGIENAPVAVNKNFDGTNTGKLICKVSEEP